ncbi:RCC1 domain-containing protein [Marimonas lutisalis]|uniref:RCC1 domain-containing protein n=1 Tax=Marimonas lutisalis TaxID=2545756 RepID=UPI001375B800|nr:hypothetical protein [Marimonas lutisalis]
MRVLGILGWVLMATLASAQEAVEIDVSETLGCVLYDDKSVYCFGEYPGDGGGPPFAAWRVEGLPPASAIAVGRFGACAVDWAGRLWCWGLDYQRSMRAHAPIVSHGPFQVEGLPPVRAAALGFNHVCAVAVDGRLWCWGENPCGEVGCGNTDRVIEPLQVPGIRGVRSLSAGVNNTCVVLWGGQLSCWGSDNPTEPGRAFVYESTRPLLMKPSYFGALSKVANGRNFACGLGEGGQVTCWGSNLMGQLGTQTLRITGGSEAIGIGEVAGVGQATDLDADLFAACAVQAGAVICWGTPTYEEPSPETVALPPEPIPGIAGATRVALGAAFGCAIADGEVLCWGLSEFEGSPVIDGMAPDRPVPVPGLP